MSARFTAALLAALFVVTAAASDIAAETGSEIFPQVMEVQGRKLNLQGVGRKYVLIFKIFIAGFYLEKGIPSERALTDAAKHLEVSYYHSVPGDRLARYTRKKMKLNLSENEYEDCLERIDVMDGYFVDLAPGDRYSLTYIPDYGTEFRHNGKLIGRIEGATFARGLFAVWVGEYPFDPGLKRKILGLG